MQNLCLRDNTFKILRNTIMKLLRDKVIILPLFVTIWVYVYVHVCTHTRNCISPVKVNTECLFLSSSYFWDDSVFLTTPGAHHFDYADWPISFQNPPVSTSPVLDDNFKPPCLFAWVFGIWTQILILIRYILYPLNHLSPSLVMTFKKIVFNDP